jgi:hypothetical protein
VLGGLADKVPQTVHATNVSLYLWFTLFSFYPPASDVGETHSLVPATVAYDRPPQPTAYIRFRPTAS